MHRYNATIQWQRINNEFTKQKYSRKHSWHFDGGLEIPAAASPQVVPSPLTDASVVDPEEAFVASLASCHMLWFLSIASREGFIVDGYEDSAEGKMEQNKEGKLAITEVILNPVVRFEPDHQPDRQIFDESHYQAHQQCFIAHSVKTDIVIDASITISS